MSGGDGQYNAGDEVAENNARKEAVRLARNDADVLRKLMNDKGGRAWLYRQLEACHIFGNPVAQVDNAPADVPMTFFNLGNQNYGKQLWLAAQAASVDLYMKMIKEQHEEQNRREAVMADQNEKFDRKDPQLSSSDQLPHIPPPVRDSPQKSSKSRNKR